MFVVCAVSGLVGARLGVADNLVHIQYATDNVQDTSLTPSLADSIEITNFGLCLRRPNPGAEPYVPDSCFNPVYMPPLPLPDNFALDDVIGNPMTLGAVAYSPDPAQQYDLVSTPMGPTSMVYIVVITMFEENLTLGYTTVNGQCFDPNLATGAAGRATQSISIHHPGEDGHFPEETHSHTVWLADDNIEVSILIAPLWYVQTHGIFNWPSHLQRRRTQAHLTVPMSPQTHQRDHKPKSS